MLGDDVCIKTNLPAQGIVTLTENGDSQVLHTLYASPVRRGTNVEIIEDIIPVYNTTVSVKSDKAPKSVKLMPEDKSLDFEYKNGRVEFTVPKIDCWQITEIKY